VLFSLVFFFGSAVKAWFPPGISSFPASEHRPSPVSPMPSVAFSLVFFFDAFFLSFDALWAHAHFFLGAVPLPPFFFFFFFFLFFFFLPRLAGFGQRSPGPPSSLSALPTCPGFTFPGVFSKTPFFGPRFSASSRLWHRVF